MRLEQKLRVQIQLPILLFSRGPLFDWFDAKEKRAICSWAAKDIKRITYIDEMGNVCRTGVEHMPLKFVGSNPILLSLSELTSTIAL